MAIAEKCTLIVSCVFPPEPVVSARISWALAESLSSKGKVVVLCPEPTRPFGCEYKIRKPSSNFVTITVNSYTCAKSCIVGRMRESNSFGIKVAKYIRKNHASIDCIYANTHPMLSQYWIIYTASAYKIPCIMHIQDLYPESITSKLGFIGKLCNGILKKVDSFFMRKATKLIAISQQMREKLLNDHGISDNALDVVYNWQDGIFYMTAEKRENRTDLMTFMYVGSLSPSANLPQIIEAFGKASLKETRLVIAGSGSDKNNCELVAAKYPKANIMITGVSPAEVTEMQSASDVLLLPLKPKIALTALPSKLTAYLLSGRPIIVCAESESEVARIVREAQCGWTIPPDSEEDLIGMYEKCLQLPKTKLEELGKRGMEYGLKHFSKVSNLKKLTDIVLSLKYDN